MCGPGPPASRRKRSFFEKKGAKNVYPFGLYRSGPSEQRTPAAWIEQKVFLVLFVHKKNILLLFPKTRLRSRIFQHLLPPAGAIFSHVGGSADNTNHQAAAGTANATASATSKSGIPTVSANTVGGNGGDAASRLSISDSVADTAAVYLSTSSAATGGFTRENSTVRHAGKAIAVNRTDTPFSNPTVTASAVGGSAGHTGTDVSPPVAQPSTAGDARAVAIATGLNVTASATAQGGDAANTLAAGNAVADTQLTATGAEVRAAARLAPPPRRRATLPRSPASSQRAAPPIKGANTVFRPAPPPPLRGASQWPRMGRPTRAFTSRTFALPPNAHGNDASWRPHTAVGAPSQHQLNVKKIKFLTYLNKTERV